MASLRLRTEPTVHQVEVILACVERELAQCGARVHRGTHDELRFRMPPPWRASGAALLRLVSAGEVRVSAGWGEPRRLRYWLRFPLLYTLGALVTAAMVGAGWYGGQRLRLLAMVLVLWAGVLLLRVVAARAVRRLLARCAREIVEAGAVRDER
ncbi:MAG TPA: hypothetical protein VFS08_18755 [Gemmatimonadaceae bacterium]|nr:hypothetical protein [Gemmatimonadaceae bacterium]